MRTGDHEQNGRDGAGYDDLASYAAIGDGRTVALVARDGRVDWLPVPSLVSVTPFAAILDAENGGFVALCPTEPFSTSRAYVDGTNVLATTFTTDAGKVSVTDSLNTGVAGRLPWTELVRRIDGIEGIEGRVAMRLVVRPGTCLNVASPWIRETHDQVVVRVDGLTLAFVASDAIDVTWDASSITGTFRTEVGSRHVAGLVGTEDEPVLVPSPADLDAGVDRTISSWQDWSGALDEDRIAEEFADDVRRSLLTLKLLIHAPSGSIAAAATTSLPESLAGGKNWDYRYAWIRDMAYTMTALHRFGLSEETHAAISWLLTTIRAHGPDPHVFYDLDGGEHESGTGEADAPGWRGVTPVVWGNDAAEQLQLGVYGDLFSIVGLYVDGGNILDARSGRLLAGLADQVCDRWRSRDAGMWELGTERHYTSSKMGCWQALTRAVRLAEQGQVPGDADRWRTEADRIRAWIDERCWSSAREAYTWYDGTDELDASVLLHAVSGFDRGPRMASTIEAIIEELGSGVHLYRYAGAQQEEGAFVACGLWLVSALALTGRLDDARRRLVRLLPLVSNDVGVMSEMVDPDTGAALGNLPQALSHLAFLNAVFTLTDQESEAG